MRLTMSRAISWAVESSICSGFTMMRICQPLRVTETILAVRRATRRATKEPYQLWMWSMCSYVVEGLFALLLDLRLHLGSGLLRQVLNAAGMDPAIAQTPRQRIACDFT